MKRTLSLVLAVLLICSCFATVSFAADAKPATPKISYVKNAATGIEVKWGAVENATSYTVYRKAGSAAKWTNLGSVSGNSTVVYTDKNVKTGTKYTYTVRSVSGTVNGTYDATGKAVVYVAMPKLVSCVNTAGSCKFTWSKVAGADGYRVYKKSGSEWKRVATIKSVSTVTYTDKDVECGVNNTYTVRAYKGSASGAYSTTGISRVFLTAPKITSYSKSGANNTVKWAKVAGASTYYIYKKTLSSGWKKIASTSKLYYTDAASSTVVYTYTVRAVKGSSQSVNSAEKTPWNMNSKANIFNFYKCAVNSIKSGKAGYTDKTKYSLTDYYFGGQKIEDTTDSATSTFNKGNSATKANFPPCTLSNLDKISSYSVQDKGSYYIIKMKLVPEKNIASMSKSYIAQISNLGISTNELQSILGSGFSSLSFTNTLSITAQIYKTGKFYSLSQSSTCPFSGRYYDKDSDRYFAFEATASFSDSYSSFKY